MTCSVFPLSPGIGGWSPLTTHYTGAGAGGGQRSGSVSLSHSSHNNHRHRRLLAFLFCKETFKIPYHNRSYFLFFWVSVILSAACIRVYGLADSEAHAAAWAKHVAEVLSERGAVVWGLKPHTFTHSPILLSNCNIVCNTQNTLWWVSSPHQVRSCGLMDKAPDFGSGDCRFESCHDRFCFLLCFVDN